MSQRFLFFFFPGNWEQEKAQGAAKEKKDESTEEEDREGDIIDSPEPHEFTVAREEIKLLLAEHRKTVVLKVRR